MPRSDERYDLVCVGFGPSGIALAAAIEDAREAGVPEALALRPLFLDRAESSAWQPNMLLHGTDIQHHFLRDFATPRDPRSRFTFANYLKEVGRLFPFCLQGARVSRIEWSDYVEWAARQVTLPVRYRQQVEGVEPVLDDGAPIDTLLLAVRDLESGETYEVTTSDVVLALGQVPFVPALFAEHLGPRVFHSIGYLERIADLDPADRPSFAVVGSGQNAGEILLHLVGAFPESEIYSIGRNSGFRTYDLGHFSNQVYFPEETDYFYGLDRERRRAVFDQVRLTNYSSVDPDVSAALYLRVYEDAVLGRERLHMLRRVGIAEVEPRDGRYRLKLSEVNRGDESSVEVDCVVLCTGFVEQPCPALLEPLRPYLRFDDGELDISRYYRVATRPELEARVYLSGMTESRHGISNATSFSMTALKAQELLDDLQRGRRIPAPRTRHDLEETPMHLQRWTQEDLVFEDEYNVWGKRLFPWDGVPEPDWGGAWVAVDPGTTSTPHGHDENEMFFIVEGSGTLEIDGESRRVQPGDTIWIPPDHEHSLTNDGDDRLLFLTIWWGGQEVEADEVLAAQAREG